MAQNDSTGVIAAFELLQGRLNAEIDAQNKIGMKAFERRDHVAARNAADRAAQVTALKDKVETLRNEWESLGILFDDSKPEEVIYSVREDRDRKKKRTPGGRRSNFGRLSSGECTPQSAFRQPILKVLDEMGGSGRVRDVLPKVKQLMQGTLKQVDDELLPGSRTPRWSKSAQWERNSMREDGLLKSNSRHGVWEITEAGRKALIESYR